MTLDRSRVEQFLSNLRANVAHLREIAAQGPEAFREDFRNHQSALRLLQISIEDMINVAGHVIARRSYRAPRDFADAFSVLAEQGIVSAAEADRYARMARFRNRIVHVYWDLDLTQVFGILEADLADFDRFAETVESLLLEEFPEA